VARNADKGWGRVASGFVSGFRVGSGRRGGGAAEEIRRPDWVRRFEPVSS
jgi:hypothetical protein